MFSVNLCICLKDKIKYEQHLFSLVFALKTGYVINKQIFHKIIFKVL